MNKPIRKYTVVIDEIARQVLLDALDLAIECDLFTNRIEDQKASHVREGLDVLPEVSSPGPVDLF